MLAVEDAWWSSVLPVVVGALLAIVGGVVGALLTRGTDRRRWLRELRVEAYAGFHRATTEYLRAVDDYGVLHAGTVSHPAAGPMSVTQMLDFDTPQLDEAFDRILDADAAVAQALAGLDLVAVESVQEAARVFAGHVDVLRNQGLLPYLAERAMAVARAATDDDADVDQRMAAMVERLVEHRGRCLEAERKFVAVARRDLHVNSPAR